MNDEEKTKQRITTILMILTAFCCPPFSMMCAYNSKTMDKVEKWIWYIGNIVVMLIPILFYIFRKK